MANVIEDVNAPTSSITGAVPTGGAVIGVDIAGHPLGGVATTVRGTYGQLYLRADGSWTFTLDNSDPDTQAIGAGEKAVDAFSYTYRINGVDQTARLAIDIDGTDAAGQIISAQTGKVDYSGSAVIGASQRLVFSSATIGVAVHPVDAVSSSTLVNRGTIDMTATTTGQLLGMFADTSTANYYNTWPLAPVSAVNEGRIDIRSATNLLLPSGMESASNAPLVNNGVVQVRSTAPGHLKGGEYDDMASASGMGGAQLINTGLVDVSSVNGPASGLKGSMGLTFHPSITNTGTIRVTGGGVSSGDRVAIGIGGVASYATVINSGSIEAIATSGTSFGILVFPNNSNVYANATIINTGIISAKVAINGTEGQGTIGLTVENGGEIDGAYIRDVGVDNVANLNGGVWRGDFTMGAGASLLVNSGTIVGSVAMGGGGDVFDGRSGTVSGIVAGGDGVDILISGMGPARLDGGSGNDLLVGNGAASSLTGGAGADRFVWTAPGTSAPDTIQDFASGTDTIDVSALGLISSISINMVDAGNAGGPLQRVTVTAAAGTLAVNVIGTISASDIVSNGTGANQTGGGADDALFARVAESSMYGGAGNDTLVGSDGADVLDGGSGADVMTGGFGGDVYLVDNDGDRVIETRGGGVDEVRSTVDYSLQANVENGVLLGTAAIGLGGNALDNHLTGNNAANYLAGREGDDVLVGRGGADQLEGGGGRDLFVYERASDSTAGSMDYLQGFEHGSDLVDLTRLDPVTFSFDEFNNPWSYPSNYTTVTIGLRTGGTMVIRLDGHASIADFVVPQLVGTAGADILSGSDAPDRIDGAGGDDRLSGLGGDDTLIGGTGDDRIDGGGGYDRAVFASLFEQSAVDIAESGVTVVGPDGRDVVVGVERFEFSDGALIFDASAVGAQIQRLYDAVLQRAPDDNGLDFYLDRIEDRGGSLLGVANDLIGSAEFQAATGALSNAEFVDYVYQHALGRAADTGGKVYYTGQLDQGLSRGSLMVSFSESAEHRGLTQAGVAQGYFNTDDNYQAVALLYDGAFGRLPDASGLTYYGERVKSGAMSLSQIAADFAGSGEFQAAIRGKSNDEIVDFIYQNTLDRAPDAGGRAYYTGQLDRGGSVAGILGDIGLSPEHYNLFASHITHGIDLA